MHDDDDVSDEGTPLPGNPAFPDVVPAGASDRTSMIDLEAVEARRAARRAEVAREASVDEAYVDLTRSETSSYLELILIIRLMTCQVAGCMTA